MLQMFEYCLKILKSFMDSTIMISIRKARINDIPSIVKLDKILYNEGNEIIKNSYPQYIEDFSFNEPHEKTSKKLVKSAIYSKNGLVLVSEIDNIVVGYLLLIIKKNKIFKLEKYGQIQTIVIEKKYRNKKISTKLIKKALEWCKEKKLKRINLFVLSNNFHAIDVYKNWGFVPFGIDMRLKI